MGLINHIHYLNAIITENHLSQKSKIKGQNKTQWREYIPGEYWTCAWENPGNVEQINSSAFRLNEEK